MAFVIVGVLLTLLKWAQLGPVAHWSWWWVLAPFGLAALWWAVADATGITQRQAMKREDERTARRRDEMYERLGLRVGPVSRDGRRGGKR